MRITRTATARGFRRSDRHHLTHALKHVTTVRAYKRLQAVWLVATGRAVKDVAQIVGVRGQTIYNWVNCYLQEHAVEALFDAPRAGRPVVAHCITPARIKREFGRDPLRLGYKTTVWTVPLLTAHLSRRYNCQLSPDTLRRRMRQMGLRWKRPRYVYAEKEPHLPQKKGLLSSG
jgi:transposase